MSPIEDGGNKSAIVEERNIRLKAEMIALKSRRYLSGLIYVCNVQISPSVLAFVLRARGSTNYAQIYFGMLCNDGAED